MAKEILTINIRLTGDYEVKGHNGNAKMLLFEGDVDCECFKGKVLPGGVDTQTQEKSSNVKLSARYILEGVDLKGQACRIFIENNGFVDNDGTIKTSPKIYTDSKQLSFLEDAKLSGTVDGDEAGIKIHISIEE